MKSWQNMRNRCFNTKHEKYETYGARGITVCERWESFANFVADMGVRPTGKTLDRINNDGNYEPSNCRWATASEQQYNKRHRTITIGGETKNVREWAAHLGISQAAMNYRIRQGLSEAAMTAPRFGVRSVGSQRSIA